ncbi:LAQU0S15e00892g1_1 [Lachancea quebecensis]|uniref:LAQU0S15e00892g1_1 n=1 Tax=Lachancea quebecensis TaxID=1654605 RepID=A0A0P1KXX3_9SACH|nr:LAQU0S15e00892g1_1 [Lachancea quebecensis]
MSAPVENTKADPKEAQEIPEVPAEEVKVAKQPVLTPAPVPTSSPWKAVPSATSAQTANSSRKWPSTQEAVEKLEKREKQAPSAPVLKSTGKEKWVPMKASIVVSGSKKLGSGGYNGANAAAKKQAGKKSRKNGPSNVKPRKQMQPHPVKDEKELKDEPAQSSGEAEDAAAVTQNPSESSDAVAAAPQAPESGFGDSTKKNGFHRRPHDSNQNGNYPRRRYQQGTPKDGNGPFKSNQPYSSFPQKPNSASFRQHNPHRTYNPGYRHKYQPRQSPGSFYGPQPPHPFVAVNNVARQIEYYFSAENLAKDNYLRSQFTEDGFAPLSLIAKFYRMVNLSFGGDETLILGALREIVANETATVDVAEVQEDSERNIGKFYVRSKNWEQWILKPEEEAENEADDQITQKDTKQRIILKDDALDAFKIEPPVFEAPQSSDKPQPDSEPVTEAESETEP